MATAGTIDILLRAQIGQFSQNMQKATGILGRFDKSLKRIGSAFLTYFSGRAILNFGRDVVEAFGRQEQAIRKLNAAMRTQGTFSHRASKDLQEYAAQIQKVSMYGDEAIIEVMALGEAIAGFTGDNLKRATIAAVGLAAAYNIDLAASMQLVARAAMGQTSTLTRYGIVLDQSSSKTEQFNQLIEIGIRNFRVAQAEAAGSAGSISGLARAWGDLKEAIGKALAGNNTFMLAIKGWTRVFADIGGAWELLIKSLEVTFLGFVDLLENVLLRQVPQVFIASFRVVKRLLTTGQGTSLEQLMADAAIRWDFTRSTRAAREWMALRQRVFGTPQAPPVPGAGGGTVSGPDSPFNWAAFRPGGLGAASDRFSGTLVSRFLQNAPGTESEAVRVAKEQLSTEKLSLEQLIDMERTLQEIKGSQVHLQLEAM